MGAFSGAGIVGANFDRRTAEPEFALGVATVLNTGYDAVYVVAGGAIAANQTDVSVDGNFSATDGAGAYVNTTAFLSGEYGWVRSATLTHAE